jgi:uncharacterized protein (UPF0333 family)
MNVKLMVGVVLFIIGIVAAVMGIASVGQTDAETAIAARDNTPALTEALGNMAIPIVAAVSLAVGGMLIGVSMGNWKNPRTHLKPGDQVVDPEGYHKMKHV